MLFDPSLNGLIRTAKLPGNLGDGSVMMQNLFDGGTLDGETITRLFLGHR